MGPKVVDGRIFAIAHVPARCPGDLDRFDIGGVPNLPDLARASLPTALAAVLEELANDDGSDNRRLARTIGQDPDLSAHIVSRANSAFYGAGGREAADLPRAIARLGREAVTYCVLHQSLVRLADDAGDTARGLLAHSLVVAELAHALGELKDGRFAEQARLAGLLHDFGKLVLVRDPLGIYRHVAATCQRESLTTCEAERRHLRQATFPRVDHAFLGEQLLTMSHLAPTTVAAVAGHHGTFVGHIGGWNDWDLTGVVLLADALARRAGYGDGIELEVTGRPLDPVLLQILDRNPAVLDAFVAAAIDRARPAVALLRADIDPLTLARRHDELAAAHAPDPAAPDHILSFRPGVGASEMTRRHGADDDDLADLRTALGADAATTSCLRRADGAFTRCAWFADGRRFVVVDRTGRVEQWDTQLGYLTAEAELDGHVTALACAADGRSVFVALERGRLVRLGGAGWTRRREFRCEGGQVLTLSASPGQDMLAVGTADGRVQLWSDACGDRDLGTAELGRHHAPVRALAWSPDGARLASGADDGTVRLWSAAERELDDLTAGHDGAVNDLAWSPDGRFVASGAADGRLDIWDVANRRYAARRVTRTGPVTRLAASADGRFLAAMGRDGGCELWSCADWTSLASGGVAVDRQRYGIPGDCFGFSPAGGVLVVAVECGRTLELWSVAEVASPWDTTATAVWGTLPAATSAAADAGAGRRARVLHLSDLHFNGGESVRTLVTDLAWDLRQVLRVDRLDAVVISGDLADTASAAEYHTAAEFIRRLEAEMAVGLERWVIVPGNHDVDWNAAPCCRASAAELEALRNGIPCPHHRECEPQKQSHDWYPERFRPYARFLRRFLRGKTYSGDYATQVDIRACADIGLHFVGYNSAWHIDRCHAKDAGIHDEALTAAKSRLGGESPRGAVTIAVWHHPLGELRNDETFSGHLRTLGVDLGLHGHIHHDRVSTIDDLTPDVTRILAAGSFSARSSALPPDTPRSYQLLTIDTATRRVHVHSRRRTAGGWDGHYVWRGTTAKDRAAEMEFGLRGSA